MSRRSQWDVYLMSGELVSRLTLYGEQDEGTRKTLVDMLNEAIALAAVTNPISLEGGIRVVWRWVELP
jgi:hypothetical protein